MFIHLHTHTEYSLLDGMGNVKALVQKAKDLGMTALAITDHGTMGGVINFYEECKAAGIKPIIGCEIYIVPDRHEKTKKTLKEQGVTDCHLVLLAKNQQGYKNLVEIVTDAHLNGFYNRPRTDMSMLEKYNEGLIALSACMKGEIPQAILKENKPKAIELALDYKRVFKKDFYLEMQANTLPAQSILNAELLKLGEELQIPMVVSCDLHYVDRADAQIHDIVLCIGTGTNINDENRMRFPTDDFFMQTEDEIRSLVNHDEAIANTCRIADMIDLEISMNNNLLPIVSVPFGYTPSNYLGKLCIQALCAYLANKQLDSETYWQRLKYELSVIQGKDLSSYLLIVWDFIKWAKENNIAVGPGRGSAAGSLVAFLLGITAIDPIVHDLLFERFINPERVSLPDIDIDFCYDNRHRVIEYVVDKYGEDCVAGVSTFGTLSARMVLDNVGMALGLDFQLRKEITKTVPEIPKISIEDALELSPELGKYHEQYPDLFRIAEKLEGKPRHNSRHACGIVITTEPLKNLTALRYSEGSSGDIVTHLNMETLEMLGLVKFDFLGLKTISVIHNTCLLLGDLITINNIPLDDAKTYELLNSTQLDGIFQFEKKWAARLLKELGPTNFSHITDAGALLRPGPLESGATKEYIAVKNGLKHIHYAHPDLEPILSNTYGVLVFQEQVIKIVQKVAGYTPGESESFRKAIGKKIKELLDEQLAIFLERATVLGYDVHFINKLADDIAKHARYGFNKSHAAAYGLITYQTAYLKANYPVQFMTALLTSDMANNEKVIQYITECRRMGIAVSRPDINKSGVVFTLEDHTIRYALTSIKNVGEKAAEEVFAKQPYSSLSDFYNKVSRKIINKKTMMALIHSGAFDTFNPNKMEVIKEYFVLRKADYKDKAEDGSTLDIDNMSTAFSIDDALKMEKESLGLYLTSHPLSAYPQSDWETIVDHEEATISGEVIKTRALKTKRGDDMAFADLDTPSGNISIVVFSRQYKLYKKQLQKGHILTVQGTRSEDKLLANTIKIGKKKQ